MKKLNLHEVYILAQRLAPVLEMRDTSKYSQTAVDLWMARNSLFEMVSDSSPLLDVAKRAGRSVIAAIGDIVPTDAQKVWDVPDGKVLGWQIHTVQSRIREFDTVLQNEMPSVPAYIVSRKGIYGTDALIERADHYFPDSLRVLIPIQARKDFCEAGKCLAFEVPTACAFHLWRSVEDTMGAYFLALTGDHISSLKNRNWAITIAALKEAGAEDSVTKFLDHIRHEYRNPQLHPDEMVSIDEALALFGAAGSALNQLAMAIQKAVEKKTPPLRGLELEGRRGILAQLAAESEANDAEGELDFPNRPPSNDAG